MTLDGVQDIFYSDPSRYRDVTTQELYDRGLSDAAFARALPFRVDQQLPSDILASVQAGARTVARCTGDADPCRSPAGCSNRGRWRQLGGAALLLRAMGVRPFTDVLWTESRQADPRWGPNALRPTPLHDLVVATLTAGPVGFGDLVNRTDAALLRLATRSDGTILKPASTALRLERFYRPPPVGGAEVWAAVAGPAGGASSALDARANSMAQLDPPVPGGIWWWSVLATEADGGPALQPAELWPRPEPGRQLLAVAINGTGGRARRCVPGAPASSCALLWDASSPLPVGTGGPRRRRAAPFALEFVLYAAAPVLHSGWTLLGELDKLVPCSPQRFVAPSDAAAPRDGDFATEQGDGFRVEVRGVPGERVAVTLVAPAERGASPLQGKLVVVEGAMGRRGSATLQCERGACTLLPGAGSHDAHVGAVLPDLPARGPA